MHDLITGFEFFREIKTYEIKQRFLFSDSNCAKFVVYYELAFYCAEYGL